MANLPISLPRIKGTSYALKLTFFVTLANERAYRGAKFANSYYKAEAI
jgi:hypothetical protein